MQRAFKYPTAFKTLNFCDVGVMVRVLELMKLGPGDVKVSPEVKQLRSGSAHNDWLSPKCGGFFGFRKKS